MNAERLALSVFLLVPTSLAACGDDADPAESASCDDTSGDEGRNPIRDLLRTSDRTGMR
jgi:hypothetical protein